MFSEPRFTRNSFSVIFSRQGTIRRLANEFEGRLKGQYFQPQIIPVPDEMDPEVPRIIFDSEHGYSQIVISQVSCSLNVTYSPDWQTQIEQGRSYMLGRAPLLFDLLEIAGVSRPHFCGLVTQVQMSSHVTDETIISHLAQHLLKDKVAADVHDVEVKTTRIVSEQFFNNITIGNYRIWTIEAANTGVYTLARHRATDRGVRIISDFNDRYSFNEQPNYNTTRAIAEAVIQGGLTSAQQAVSQIGASHESINQHP
jgi:hypothetical protein